MAKLMFFVFIYLFRPNACTMLPAKELGSVAVLPDKCEGLLQLFANETAKFTLCVITNARPINVCENCVNEYNRVNSRYEKLHENNTKSDCRKLLTNIDRLEVVYASYNYVLDMWKKASCALCLNGTVLNDRSKNLMRLGTFLDSCISNHKNGTEPNSTLCSDCKEDYLNLTNYYNEYKVYNGFCMDIVDLINRTQTEWSVEYRCHISNYDSEWVLIVVSCIVLLLPILFYFINWLLSQERSNILLYQTRWHERFTNSTASTSGYVVIS